MLVIESNRNNSNVKKNKNNSNVSTGASRPARRNANKSIFSQATDQVISHVRNRYTGPGATFRMAKDLSKLVGVVNTEDKHVDTSLTFVGSNISNTTYIIVPILGPAQGTTNSTRIGNSIKVNRFDYTLSFVLASGTTLVTQTQIFRWFLVRYLKTPSSSGQTAFGMSEFLNIDPNSQYTPLSLCNTDTNENFVIMDTGVESLSLTTPTTGVYTYSVKTGTKDVGFHQDFTGSASTTISNNQCFVVCVALAPANSSGPCEFGFTVRQWYIDN